MTNAKPRYVPPGQTDEPRRFRSGAAMKQNIFIAMLLFGVAIAVADGAFAQQIPPKKQQAKSRVSPPVEPQRWEKEPDSFMGIKFGATLPECVKKGPDYDYTAIYDEKLRCFTMMSNTISEPWTVHGLPDIGVIVRETHPHLINGTAFEGLYFQFWNRDYSSLEGLFIARYGEPTHRETVTLKNKVGLSFENSELSWRGKNVTIMLSKYASQFDQGKVDVVTQTFLKIRQEQQKVERDKLKENL